jgi:hypothetical protein
MAAKTCTATAKLTPFATAGNVEAMYMLGMIKCYGDCNVAAGIPLLQSAASRGYVEAMYALGLVLRDSRPDEARSYLELAADAKRYPAMYQLGRLLKSRYGALSLLGTVNESNASHCWNPLCGRWAFKATSSSDVCVPKDRVVSCMKSCTRCQQAKYCSKLCLSFDRRTRRHIRERISIRNKRAVVLYKP